MVEKPPSGSLPSYIVSSGRHHELQGQGAVPLIRVDMPHARTSTARSARILLLVYGAWKGGSGAGTLSSAMCMGNRSCSRIASVPICTNLGTLAWRAAATVFLVPVQCTGMCFMWCPHIQPSSTLFHDNPPRAPSTLVRWKGSHGPQPSTFAALWITASQPVIPAQDTGSQWQSQPVRTAVLTSVSC